MKEICCNKTRMAMAKGIDANKIIWFLSKYRDGKTRKSIQEMIAVISLTEVDSDLSH